MGLTADPKLAERDVLRADEEPPDDRVLNGLLPAPPHEFGRRLDERDPREELAAIEGGNMERRMGSIRQPDPMSFERRPRARSGYDSAQMPCREGIEVHLEVVSAG
jgi:hypothetical protein